MKLSEVQVGEIYKCKLSKKEMLVLELDKPIHDAEGNQTSTEKVKAGKYVDEINGVPTFKVDEIADGQLEELTNE